MRSSTQAYIQTASNHVMAIRYNELDRILTIKFYNNAVYEYLNVPLGTYEAMMQAPSHGCFLWDHIRGQFPYRRLQADNSPQNVAHEICPELAKLDKLDTQELKADRDLRRCVITEEEHNRLVRVIAGKKEKLIKKLEKDGYFDSDIDEELDYSDDEYEEEEADYFGAVLNIIGEGFKLLFIVFIAFFGLMGALMR